MIYKNAKIDGKIIDIQTENGKISGIGNYDDDGIDLGGLNVFAGLVDIHAHGCIGYDTMDGKHLDEMSYYLAKNGTTSWFPTTMTVSMDEIKAAVNIEIPKTKGCNILGFHMEGPYISVNHKGAQNEKFIKKPDFNEFSTLKNIKMITLAPELENSMEFIKNCSAVVSLGHTDADYDCTKKAIKNGAECLTHTFNAMPPLHHRNPGVIGAAIEDNIYVQVICDGVHIHKSVIKMLYRTFGAERMILISDMLCATGMDDGKYVLGGQDIVVENSVARTLDGTIAGSTSPLLKCVKKAVEFGIPVKDAFKMASYTPSKLMNLRKGKIEVGYDADFIAVDDELKLQMTVVDDKIIS